VRGPSATNLNPGRVRIELRRVVVALGGDDPAGDDGGMLARCRRHGPAALRRRG
jgi:hypothetical protein